MQAMLLIQAEKMAEVPPLLDRADPLPNRTPG
jgi:hypothetical protein